ncbi:MAG: nucleotidyl transferase AbiEii/AbiGii toxin family protein [Gemmatimonadota bacterium]
MPKLRSLEAIFRELNAEGIRYLVAGGVAVNVHGYQRMTQDLDLIVDLARENVLGALRALGKLGYRPVLPVEAEDFADPAKRRAWVETKNLQVFSLTSEEHQDTTVDLFAGDPFSGRDEYARAVLVEIAPALEVPFVHLATLIAMKEGTGRARDSDDVEHLREIQTDLEAGPDRVRETGGWVAATWGGSRREQLRRALRLSASERLEGLEALTETSERLKGIARPDGGP